MILWVVLVVETMRRTAIDAIEPNPEEDVEQTNDPQIHRKDAGIKDIEAISTSDIGADSYVFTWHRWSQLDPTGNPTGNPLPTHIRVFVGCSKLWFAATLWREKTPL